MLTPCIRFCVLDADSGLCAGCGRTAEEIGNWTAYSEAERRAIMALLPSRLAARKRGLRPEAGKVAS